MHCQLRYSKGTVEGVWSVLRDTVEWLIAVRLRLTEPEKTCEFNWVEQQASLYARVPSAYLLMFAISGR